MEHSAQSPELIGRCLDDTGAVGSMQKMNRKVEGRVECQVEVRNEAESKRKASRTSDEESDTPAMKKTKRKSAPSSGLPETVRGPLPSWCKCFVMVSTEKAIPLKLTRAPGWILKSNRIQDEKVHHALMSYAQVRRPVYPVPRVILRNLKSGEVFTLVFPIDIIESDGNVLEFTPTHWYRKQKQYAFSEHEPIRITCFYYSMRTFRICFDYADNDQQLNQLKLELFFHAFISHEYEDSRSQLMRLCFPHPVQADSPS